MYEDILTDGNGNRWRVKAKSYQAALNEIAMARCTGSVGSSCSITNGLFGTELVAEVHKIDADGNDVLPS